MTACSSVNHKGDNSWTYFFFTNYEISRNENRTTWNLWGKSNRKECRNGSAILELSHCLFLYYF